MGFLPTPASPGRHERLFALAFEGSTTTAATTCVLDAPDLPSGLLARGYHTACIGGVGFFNQKNALGRVFPALFDESHWAPELGVTDLPLLQDERANVRDDRRVDVPR